MPVSILPAQVTEWGRRLWRRYHGYFDSYEDYWQTVALVWYRCLGKVDPDRPVERYFARALVHEFWHQGLSRLRLPKRLPEDVEGLRPPERRSYPESLKELMADFHVVRTDLESML